MSAAIGDRGIAYDSCDACGTENEPFSTHGAPGERHDWSVFVCGGAGPGSGAEGCGRNWSRTTARGRAHNDAVGTPTAGLTADAELGRHSADAFGPRGRADFDLIFGRGDAAALPEAERHALLLARHRARLGLPPEE